MAITEKRHNFVADIAGAILVFALGMSYAYVKETQRVAELKAHTPASLIATNPEHQYIP